MSSAIMEAAPTAGSGTGIIRRTSVGLLPATATLTRQKVWAAVRSGDVIFAVLSPVAFFICFYVPLHRRFDATGIDYAQFITPVILLQAGLFTAIAATESAGADARAGVRERLASLPIPRVAPVLGRLGWVVIRMLLATAGGLAIAFALGFRFHGSISDTVLFIALVVIFGLTLSMFTDVIGSFARNSTGMASVLTIPQLVLVMASTGLVPATGFPDWAQPVVRNQPLSAFADALRGLSTGADVELAAVGWWSAGLLVAGIGAVVLAGRKQVGR